MAKKSVRDKIENAIKMADIKISNIGKIDNVSTFSTVHDLEKQKAAFDKITWPQPENEFQRELINAKKAEFEEVYSLKKFALEKMSEIYELCNSLCTFFHDPGSVDMTDLKAARDKINWPKPENRPQAILIRHTKEHLSNIFR